MNGSLFKRHGKVERLLDSLHRAKMNNSNIMIIFTIITYCIKCKQLLSILNFWIYNLIRAVFFQNLNVYLRKKCTIVLFKVLPI